MITLNGIKLDFEKFPNGETRVNEKQILDNIHYSNQINFKYQDDSDLIKLLLVKKYLDERQDIICGLLISYMPYSRMDRVEGNSVFTLKYITDFINSLNFKEVIVIEPHSDVTPALLNNCRSVFPSFDILNNVMKEVNFNKDKDYLFFPDQGAAKRYGKTKGFKQLVGFKERDFQTGKINKLQVIGDIQEQGFKVIIQDDLCSYGGTFLMSGNKLKELGASEIYLLVTHCENSIYQGELLKENSPIDKIFTTDSILTLGTDKIITYSLN